MALTTKNTIQKYTLDVHMESTEGIHDFLGMLERIVEDIKGGYESYEPSPADPKPLKMRWKINTHSGPRES